MSRLIIVSNRLPFSIDQEGDQIKLRQSSGGLVSAIKSYFESDHSLEEIKEKLWVGVADFPQEDWDKLTADRSNIDFEIKPLFVDKQVISRLLQWFLKFSALAIVSLLSNIGGVYGQFL